jgi:hypothetical protein
METKSVASIPNAQSLGYWGVLVVTVSDESGGVETLLLGANGTELRVITRLEELERNSAFTYLATWVRAMRSILVGRSGSKRKPVLKSDQSLRASSLQELNQTLRKLSGTSARSQ